MRALVALAVVACLSVAVVVSTQPQPHDALRNAYWPFSVEVSVRDR